MSRSNGGSNGNGKHVTPIAVGGLRGLLTKNGDVSEANQKAVETLREEAPVVADILGGSPQVGTNPGIEPGSVTLYVRQGKLCWSAIVKSEKVKFYGECQDALKPLQAINCALMLGEYSVTTYTERESSYTKEQEKAIL